MLERDDVREETARHMGTCGDCAAYVDDATIDEPCGECHRHPPVPIDGVFQFPPVSASTIACWEAVAEPYGWEADCDV